MPRSLNRSVRVLVSLRSMRQPELYLPGSVKNVFPSSITGSPVVVAPGVVVRPGPVVGTVRGVGRVVVRGVVVTSSRSSTSEGTMLASCVKESSRKKKKVFVWYCCVKENIDFALF